MNNTSEHIAVTESFLFVLLFILDENRELQPKMEPKSRDKDTENPIPHRVFGVFKTGISYFIVIM